MESLPRISSKMKSPMQLPLIVMARIERNTWGGSTCQPMTETVQLLHRKCPGRVISRRGDVNWPPISVI